MSDDWFRVQGDTNDTIDATIGGVGDLEGVSTVSATVWRTSSPASQSTLTAAVLDPDAGTVRISLGSWITTAAVGVWRVAVHLTGAWDDGTSGRKTIPPQGGATLTIGKAGT
jgi:hypothetical protein